MIKFSHVVAAETPKGKGALKFKELAEKATNGKVKVEVYANSQLYKDGEELQMLQLGSVQMLAPSVSKFGPLGAREFEVFDLPYIFDNREELHKVTQGKVGQMLFKKLEAKGLLGLAYWDNGFKDMSANKPLRMPADFRGLKMRIQSSKVLEAQMRALGATPQVMAFAEVYQALQTGVVDGTENPALEPVHAEDERGAEIRDAFGPWRHRIRRRRQQEILGRPAGRYPQGPRRRDEGSHQVRQRHRQGRERRRAGQGEGHRQDADHHAHARGERRRGRKPSSRSTRKTKTRSART